MSTKSPICRICLSSESISTLIAPCKCKGSVKYVHSTCLTLWRNRLLKSRRGKNLDRCTSCQFKYVIRKKKTVGNFLNRGDVKVTITLITVLALLVPCGYIMKLLIMMTSSLYYVDDTIINTENLMTPVDESVLKTIATPATWSSFNLPFCTALSPTDIVLHNDIVYSTIPLLIIKLFPSITDTEFWFRIMCNRLIQHLHLGLFFLGSISNIYTAYVTVDELFSLFMEERRRETRQTVLALVCAIVMCFWFHYTLTAFSVPSTTEFLKDLPVWFLRWTTISLAIFDFGLRRVFFRLNKFREDIEILSVQNMDFDDE
ncbi:3500_t:CDS:2 [Acaulospora morrowiae]|uniref:3500_t:CDS:1 n=1 Tax=Acaulospora morrowiae TaxID=94023 RepID=A0A9N9CN24_9GLOM|nr:3500_t:CDS:2 [Acaulospora morrowiae]